VLPKRQDKQHMINEKIKGKKQKKEQPTLRQLLSRDWKYPSKGYIETQEGYVMPLLKPELTADLAFEILFTAIIRHYSEPRQDKLGSKSVSVGETQIQYLCQLASILGFDNSKIRDGIFRKGGFS
jgi:hypothetical protein